MLVAAGRPRDAQDSMRQLRSQWGENEVGLRDSTAGPRPERPVSRYAGRRWAPARSTLVVGCSIALGGQMGCSAIASCPCGYDSGELMIGGGMRNFHEVCLFPAYCKEGNHLVDINMHEHPRRCSAGHATEPVPYNSQSLIKTIGPEVVAEWGWLDEGNHVVLTNGQYFCPACHQYTLTFRDGGIMWD